MAGTIEVTERWDGISLSRTADLKSWSATREFDVVGIGRTLTVAGALHADPQFASGAVHPYTDLISVQTATPKCISPGFYRVSLQYGYGNYGDTENPLEQPPVYDWRFGSASEPVDLDYDGNPIVNSALDAYDPNDTDEFTTIFLTYSRNEPFFDLQKPLKYMNRVNQNGFAVRRLGFVQPGQAKCLCIMPSGPFTDLVNFVNTRYEFEFRAGRKMDSDGLWDGFKSRRMDQGTRCFYEGGPDGVPGDIYLPDYKKTFAPTPTTTPIRLDGYGGVFDDGKGYVVTGEFKNSQSSGSSPKGAIVEVGANGVFLKYLHKKPVDFGGMQL